MERKFVFMKKLFCLLLVAAMSVAILNPLAVDAKEIYSEDNLSIVASDEIIEFVTYEGEINETLVEVEGASPRIVVSKYVEITIHIPGHVTPDDNYTYTVFDKDYNTTMTGNLLLKSHIKDYNALMQKETRARYGGYIYATI